MRSDSIFLKIAIFAVGFGAGLFTGKMMYKTYYEKIARDEIDNVKEVFKNRRRMHVVRNENENGMSDKEYKDRVERTNNNPLTRSSLDCNPYEQAKRNYNLVRDEPPSEEGPPEKEEKNEPYIIDGDQFADEFDHHEKECLHYYMVDDVLCSENEEIVSIEDTVGYDAISVLDTQTTAWVRNERLAVDYEIIAVKDSYAKSVHGIGTEENLSPREMYERRMKRRDKNEEE